MLRTVAIFLLSDTVIPACLVSSDTLFPDPSKLSEGQLDSRRLQLGLLHRVKHFLPSRIVKHFLHELYNLMLMCLHCVEFCCKILLKFSHKGHMGGPFKHPYGGTLVAVNGKDKQLWTCNLVNTVRIMLLFHHMVSFY